MSAVRERQDEAASRARRKEWRDGRIGLDRALVGCRARVKAAELEVKLGNVHLVHRHGRYQSALSANLCGTLQDWDSVEKVGAPQQRPRALPERVGFAAPVAGLHGKLEPARGPHGDGSAIERVLRVGNERHERALGDRVVAEAFGNRESLLGGTAPLFGLSGDAKRARHFRERGGRAALVAQFAIRSKRTFCKRDGLAGRNAERIEHALDKIGLGLPAQAAGPSRALAQCGQRRECFGSPRVVVEGDARSPK